MIEIPEDMEERIAFFSSLSETLPAMKQKLLDTLMFYFVQLGHLPEMQRNMTITTLDIGRQMNIITDGECVNARMFLDDYLNPDFKGHGFGTSRVGELCDCITAVWNRHLTPNKDFAASSVSQDKAEMTVDTATPAAV